MNWFDKGYLPNLLWQQKYKFPPTFPHIYSNYFYLALYFYCYYVCNLQKINYKAVICRIFALGGAFLGGGVASKSFSCPCFCKPKRPSLSVFSFVVHSICLDVPLAKPSCPFSTSVVSSFHVCGFAVSHLWFFYFTPVVYELYAFRVLRQWGVVCFFGLRVPSMCAMGDGVMGKERKDNGCKIAIVPPIGFSTP